MALPKHNILVVDDEPLVRKLLRRCFEKEGFGVYEAANGAEMFEALDSHQIQLITLDISLEIEDGLDLAREVRKNSTVPIIMVTGKGELIDTVVGLEVGADDYISKPFELREVIARVRAVLRRYQANQQPATPLQKSADVYAFAQWTLNTTTRELHDTDQAVVPLTTGEYELLRLFVESGRRVLTRDQIMNRLKGNDWLPNDRTIDNQVARLRRKLTQPPGETTLIKTIRGSGYLFTPEVAVVASD
ncbi:DNA-binding response regulator [Chromatiales bacterium (ex Bugula neritina AB1)]|nr:DNA-binding response regulator [Chromatiales bacterium (ex Bugula neritina AB1)]